MKNKILAFLSGFLIMSGFGYIVRNSWDRYPVSEWIALGVIIVGGILLIIYFRRKKKLRKYLQQDYIVRISISEEEFIKLVNGKEVYMEPEQIKLILQDIGFERMREIIIKASVADGLQ